MGQNIRQWIAVMEQQLSRLYQQGQYNEAIGVATQAVTVIGRQLGKADSHYAAGLNNLALLYSKTGDYAAAEPLFKEAIELGRAMFGEDHPSYAASLNNLALLYSKMGDYAAAEPLLRQALEIRHARLGGGHPAYAESLNNLALLHLNRGDYAAAEPLFKRAIEIGSELGRERPDYAQSLNNLAALYSETGNYVAAEPLHRQAIEIRRDVLGEAHPDYAESLHNLAALYVEMGDYAAAEPLHQQALEIYRKALTENHPAYLTSLGSLASLYSKTGDYAAAESLFQQAKEIRRNLFGENHPGYAAGLNHLASFFQGVRKFAAAEPLLRQSIEICRSALGENHPAYFESLGALAVLYIKMGSYMAAVSVLEEVVNICRTAFGEDSPHYARILNFQANLYIEAGNYAEAESLSKQAIEIRRTLFGEDHPEYAESLNDLAALYLEVGKYEAAEPLLRQAKEIRSRALDEHDPDYVESLNNLAVLYEYMGDYAAAEPLYRQAFEVTRTAPGEINHHRRAGSLNNLANLYAKMGDHRAAEPLLKQALEISRALFGENHPGYALSLHNLASLYIFMGDYETSASLLAQVMEIRRAQLGENHPDYALSLNNLAGLYEVIGDYETSASLYRQVLQIYSAALGEDHPDYAGSLNNLALMLRWMGDYDAAEPLYQRALEILRARLGENHPQYAESLQNLAGLYVATSRVGEALSLMQRAMGIEDQMIGQVFSVGSESQRMAYLGTIRGDFDRFLSLVSQHLPESPEAVRAALRLVLRRRAISAEALATQRDVVLGGRYPALEPKLRELNTLRMQLARKALAGPGAEGLPAHQEILAAWGEQKDRLEAELARQIPEMNLEQKFREADSQAVARALPAGAALVEFVRVNVFDFNAVPARGDQRRKPARYLAFVLPAGEPDNVRMLDLGEAEPIDGMIEAFRAAVTDEEESLGLQEAANSSGERTETASHQRGSELRSAIFDPLSAAVGNRKRLLLAPDGDLNRLPFEVLPADDDRLLIDDYRISYFSVGRDALRFVARPTSQASAALVMADPDFDLTGDTTGDLLQSTESTATGVMRSPALSRLPRDVTRSELHFERLPGTKVEGQRVAELLGVEPHLTTAALESHLKSCRSPRVLHLATHGFFLPHQKRDPAGEQEELMMGVQSNNSTGQFLNASLENPLLRSGLALAAANTWLRKGNVPPEAEDGFLTAEDVTGLDMLATELVVLSACDTGLGETLVGEGVFGLRRAFVLAGARTLVMSLWSVPDLATAVLMERFYDNLLRRQAERDEALREAQLYVRGVTIGELRGHWLNEDMIGRLAAGDLGLTLYLRQLAEMKDEHRPFVHPRYWGAFICQGDTAVLR